MHLFTGVSSKEKVRERQQESKKNSNFGERLRAAREMLGITQDLLGKSWDLTGNYIYLLESGKKPFPKKLEFQLIELEGKVREKLDAHSAPARAPRPSVFVLEEGPLQRQTHSAPLVPWISAGAANHIDPHLAELVATDCPDPNRYALIVENDSMSPKIECGDRIVIAPNARGHNGDVVVARLEKSGEVFLKLYHEAHGLVRLSSFNHAYPTLEYKRAEFRFIHPVYSLVRKLRAKPKV